MFKENGTYLGRVEDPTMAKLAPLVNLVSLNESRYGLKSDVFKLWPAMHDGKKLKIKKEVT